MRLFHFSEEPGIEVFRPRLPKTLPERPAGREWLNGALVWAVDEAHQPLYLFPRDCPRILLWQTSRTTEADRAAWWGHRSARFIACVEWAWRTKIQSARLYRYELPSSTFLDLDDAGMWVTRTAVECVRMDIVDDLMDTLASCNVELRFMSDLTSLRHVWSTSVQASGIRLRNASGWH